MRILYIINGFRAEPAEEMRPFVNEPDLQSLHDPWTGLAEFFKMLRKICQTLCRETSDAPRKHGLNSPLVRVKP